MSTATTGKIKTPFYKTGFAKFTAGLFSGALLLTVTSLLFIPKANFSISGSGRISLDEAYRLMQNWSDTALIHIDSLDTKVPLRGFVFNAEQIDSIINKNAALDSGIKADDIVFFLGRSGETTTGAWPFRHRYTKMRLIAIGSKDSSLLIEDRRTPKPSMDVFVPSVYDKADPCPGPHCPKKKAP